MWYVIKIDYVAPESPERQSKAVGFGELDAARRIYDRLELSYLLGTPVRVRAGNTIRVQAVALLESFRDHYADAIAAVEAGEATLMQQAQGIDLNL